MVPTIAPVSVSAAAVGASLSLAPCPISAGDPEVEELGEAVGRDHHVLGLDVAVEDAGGVRVVQGFEEAPGHGHGLGDRKRSPRQPRAEGLPRDELHGQEGDAVRLAGVVESRDCRVLQAGARLGFAQEAVAERRGQRLGQDFDRGGPAQGQIAAEEDLAHPSGAEAFLDAIVRQGLPDQGASDGRTFSLDGAAGG